MLPTIDCGSCLVALAFLALPGVAAQAEPEEIPTTIPSNCGATAPTSLPSAWGTGPCTAGADARRWQFSPNGTVLEPDPDYCSSGKISCAKRAQKAWSHPHLLLHPSKEVAPSNLLVVFLPGTGSAPSRYSRLLQSASIAGHMVIGLSYLSMPVSSAQTNWWCDPHPPSSMATASDCSQELHQQMLFGEVEDRYLGKAGDLWPVRRDHSVEGLLEAVLNAQPWGSKFLNRSRVDWTRVIISGHSQGASHGAYLSQLRATRAVLFSGPQDSQASAAAWVDLSVPTDVERRSLYHLHEECAEEPRDQATNCEAGLLPGLLRRMGFGIASRYDGPGSDLPSNLTNVITTWAPVCQGGRFYHSSTAADPCAPVGAEELWTALFSGMRVAEKRDDQNDSSSASPKYGIALAMLLFTLEIPSRRSRER